MVARVIPVDPFDLVIFGATGDLARRKILPGLYRRFRDGQVPPEARIIGAARSDLDSVGFRREVAATLHELVPAARRDAQSLRAFCARLDYVTLDADADADADAGQNAGQATGWPLLREMLRDDVVRAFYFSVAPALFGDLAARLHEHGIANADSRVVVEKPFGHDLESARALNAILAQHFNETQVYRIDHYLGKETVQNLMAVRFANTLFEPLWNARFVDNVQISVAETVGVQGRGGYYDGAGAMRDMVQNHLMQLLCLIAMEPPFRFDPDAVRDEKLKVIRALDPADGRDVVRGQYHAGPDMAGYLADAGVAASTTETFVALRVQISNWRWKGTPFYLRTGKRLSARASEIAVTFREPPHSIFGESERWHENVLVIRLQPDEGMKLHVMIKEPGPGGMRLKDVPLDMSFAEALGEAGTDIPDAYERLIMDVIRGNQTLFMRGDEVEAAWAWTDPVIAGWSGEGPQTGTPPYPYTASSSGPEAAQELLRRDGRRWREIAP